MKQYLITYLAPILGARFYRPQNIELKADSRNDVIDQFKKLKPNTVIVSVLERIQHV